MDRRTKKALKLIAAWLMLCGVAFAGGRCDVITKGRDGANGFLLKASDTHTGMVCLLPEWMTNMNVTKVQLFTNRRRCREGTCKSKRNRRHNLIFSGVANGDRRHYREYNTPLNRYEGTRIVIRAKVESEAVIEGETNTQVEYICFDIRNVDGERND